MPLMHRLACFRDDIIFFIYLYQRWIYAVDLSRVNEFGQGGDDQPESPAVAPSPAVAVEKKSEGSVGTEPVVKIESEVSIAVGGEE
jgi:hypothetical protein